VTGAEVLPSEADTGAAGDDSDEETTAR
jgi:hypothetical protein